MNLTTDKCVFLDAKWWEFLGGDICRNVDGENIRTYAMCFDSACPKIAQKGLRAKDSSFSSQSTDISHIWAVFRQLAQGMFWNLVFVLKNVWFHQHCPIRSPSVFDLVPRKLNMRFEKFPCGQCCLIRRRFGPRKVKKRLEKRRSDQYVWFGVEVVHHGRIWLQSVFASRPRNEHQV